MFIGGRVKGRISEDGQEGGGARLIVEILLKAKAQNRIVRGHLGPKNRHGSNNGRIMGNSACLHQFTGPITIPVCLLFIIS